LATRQGVKGLCDLYEVSHSGYYDWLKRKPGKRGIETQKLREEIRKVHQQSQKTYGSPRVTQALRKQGVRCGENRVAGQMRQMGLQGAQKARFRPRTTDSRHTLPISPNRLEGRPWPEHLNEIWVSDITYVPTLEGWMYLAALMDLKSRKIKGWSLKDHMKTDLVEEAFLQAIFRDPPPPGLIVHSDRGSQYASLRFRNLLEHHKALSSMSARGYCYDNATMESFWATLKTELSITQPFSSRHEARLAIFQYIEAFYNRSRLHSSLGYCSPLDFEAKCPA
jgi:transposase InsO family protein